MSEDNNLDFDLIKEAFVASQDVISYAAYECKVALVSCRDVFAIQWPADIFPADLVIVKHEICGVTVTANLRNSDIIYVDDDYFIKDTLTAYCTTPARVLEILARFNQLAVKINEAAQALRDLREQYTKDNKEILMKIAGIRELQGDQDSHKVAHLPMTHYESRHTSERRGRLTYSTSSFLFLAEYARSYK